MSDSMREIVAGIDRNHGSGSGQAPKLTKAQLEELVANAPDDRWRRRWQSKLDAVAAAEERQARSAAMTPREIVDSIPRGIQGIQ